MLDFRSEARMALSRARFNLGSGDEGLLKYAVLELWLAMEAIAYDHLHA